MVIRAIQQMTRPLAVRIANLVARAVVRVVNDDTRLQTLQLGVLADETRDNVERVQEYGFTSVPLPGALAAVVFVGGRREHGLVLGVDDPRHRLRGLQPGEVALYTDEGDSIVIRRGGTVQVNARRVELIGDTDAVALASKVQGELTRLADVLRAWVPVPQDGGLALRTALVPLLGAIPLDPPPPPDPDAPPQPAWPGDVGSENVRAS